MAVIDRKMPAGFPGNVTRRAVSIAEPVKLKLDTAYGATLALDAAGEAVVTTAAANVTGFLVRPYPTQAGPAGQGPGGTIQDRLVSGYITVRLSANEETMPVAGTPVKLIAATADGYTAGEIAVSAGVAISRAVFTGPPDTDGNVEIAFNV